MIAFTDYSFIHPLWKQMLFAIIACVVTALVWKLSNHPIIPIIIALYCRIYAYCIVLFCFLFVLYCLMVFYFFCI